MNGPRSDPTRRDVLKTAVAAAITSCWPAGLLAGSPVAPRSPQDGARQTLDGLLQQHRNRVLALEGRIGGTLAHVPLALMAMYRIGASPEQMQRFFGDRTFAAPRVDKEAVLTVDDWRRHLRTGVAYSRWFAFFDSWLEQAPVETVLAAALPTLIEGGVSAFDHTLIHAGYAVDYGERHELAHALASWASTRGANQEVDLAPDAVEPDALLAAIVDYTRDLQLNPRGGNSGPIAWRLNQVQRHKEYARQLKPVRIPTSDPLKKFAEIILDLFSETHEFTMLHALTTCQALRLLLPYVGEPKKTLNAYWHSVCSSYVTVRRMPQFEGAKQGVPSGEAAWTEILPKAAAADAAIHESQYVHRVKLVYSCQQESRHYQRDLYRAVAAREVERASQIILG